MFGDRERSRQRRPAASAAGAEECEHSSVPKGSAALSSTQRLRAAAHTLHAWLTQPVHASTLGTFRVFFSVCMYKQALYFADMFWDFQHSLTVFPYPALGWVTPCGPWLGEWLLTLNSWAAIAVCVGLCTRAATAVLFGTFTYLFLICESNHNNHYILICHTTSLCMLTQWVRVIIAPPPEP
jgi:hypothetical protein